MPPTTPLILAENFFDTTIFATSGSLTASSQLTGREVYRISDARRERSWWQAATTATNHGIAIDLGAGVSVAADYLWIDRGHNLWGHNATLQAGTDGVTFPTNIWNRAVPALGTLGGDPTTGWSVTEEGALYTLFSGAPAKRGWNLVFPDSMQPVVPGAMLGRRAQLLRYSRVKDEDAMSRTEVQETSRAGYLGTDRRYAWRTVTLDLIQIGASEYDAMIRTLRQQLFELDAAFVCAMDYGTKPERAWLYRWDGTRYSAATSRVNRATTITGREVGPLIR
jgi:hypothetical protein